MSSPADQEPRDAPRPGWPALVALLVAALVFAGVLLVTPPGFAAFVDLLIGPARGARGLAAAYALGAAASLALVSLLAVALLLTVVDRLRRRE